MHNHINPNLNLDPIVLNADLKHLPFTKMQGAGNDFVVIDAITNSAFSKLLKKLNTSQKTNLIRKLCDRHYGIGADQFLIIEVPDSINCDFKYRIFNQDGSEVEHCGNGARCFARYVFDHGLTEKTIIKVQIIKGEIELSLTKDLKYVNVMMNTPSFIEEDIPFKINSVKDTKALEPKCIQVTYPLAILDHLTNDAQHALKITLGEALGRFYQIQHPEFGLIEFSIASMGNPHALIDFDRYIENNILLLAAKFKTGAHALLEVESELRSTNNFWHFDLAPLAQFLQQHSAFYQGVNIGLIKVLNSSEALLRVYERGSGETLACGTGACAAVALSILSGKLNSQNTVKIQARGGELYIKWSIFTAQHTIPNIIMTGSANYSFKGFVNLESFI